MQELMTIGTAIATVVAVLVGVVVTIVVAYAGFMYATAAGDPQKTGMAKNAFVGAFIGLIIASVVFIGPRIITDMVIKPVGGVAIESEVGLNCDGILRNQLVFQRGASTEDRMNVVIAQIQSQQAECASDVWGPVVLDLGTTGTTGDDAGHCYSAAGAPVAFDSTTADAPKIGIQELSDGLVTAAGTTAKPRAKSGRDSENNIVVYFNLAAASRPSDGASCWLYYSRLKAWHANFY